MKTVAIRMDDDLHKKFKLFAIHHDKTMAEIVIKLIQKELETKKEQTR